MYSRRKPHLVAVDLHDEHVLVLIGVAVEQRAPARGLGHHPVALAEQAADLDLRVAGLEQPLTDGLEEVLDDRLPPALCRQAARHVVYLPDRVVGEELADRREVPGAERVEEPPHHVLGVGHPDLLERTT